MEPGEYERGYTACETLLGASLQASRKEVERLREIVNTSSTNIKKAYQEGMEDGREGRRHERGCDDRADADLSNPEN